MIDPSPSLDPKRREHNIKKYQLELVQIDFDMKKTRERLAKLQNRRVLATRKLDELELGIRTARSTSEAQP